MSKSKFDESGRWKYRKIKKTKNTFGKIKAKKIILLFLNNTG